MPQQHFWTPTQSADDPTRFHLDVTNHCCVGPEEVSFLMGGVSTAAAIEAMEQATGRPLYWATVQFVGGATKGDRVDIKVDLPERQGKTLQLGVTLTVNERLLLRVMGATGGREGIERSFATMPDVPSPADATPWEVEALAAGDNMFTRFERRIAVTDEEAGCQSFWSRMPHDGPTSLGQLAITADFFLGCHSYTHRGTSLDHGLRVHNLVETEWVLTHVQFDGFTRGGAHGHFCQFAEDGTLLTSGAQTGLAPRR